MRTKNLYSAQIKRRENNVLFYDTIWLTANNLHFALAKAQKIINKKEQETHEKTKPGLVITYSIEKIQFSREIYV